MKNKFVYLVTIVLAVLYLAAGHYFAVQGLSFFKEKSPTDVVEARVVKLLPAAAGAKFEQIRFEAELLSGRQEGVKVTAAQNKAGSFAVGRDVAVGDKVLLLPGRVQGTEAPAESAGAIRYANRHALADVLITGRGGGSLEDLWAFNDERGARAIYDSEIPVISAVGHEPDVAISDFVADRRASTPSNAAEIAVPDREELLRALDSAEKRMEQAAHGMLRRQGQRLDALAEKRVMTEATAFVEDRRQDVDHMTHRLCAGMRAVADGQGRRFGALAAALDALSPLKVLGRGYAVAQRSDGTVVRSAGQVERGERLRLRLAQGGIVCEVKEKDYGGEKDV